MHSDGMRPQPHLQAVWPWRTRQPLRGWEHVVLPAQTVAVLEELVRTVRARAFQESPGDHARAAVMALFTGEPGTGKKTAARVVAGELSAPVIEIDTLAAAAHGPAGLAAAVHQAMQEGVQSRAVLVFDDAASSLRSGRADSDVIDLPGRSAHYPGLVVFCSRVSVRLSPDQAQHFDAMADFPIPEQRAREQLWRNALPPDAALTEAEVAFLARSFRLSGAAIAACAGAAAERARRTGVRAGRAEIAGALRAHYSRWVLASETERALAEISAQPPAAPDEPTPGPELPTSDPATGPAPSGQPWLRRVLRRH